MRKLVLMFRSRGGRRRLGAKLWREWVKPLVIVVVVLGSFKTSVADWYDVPTGSMKPTILEGDRIAVNKLAYDLKVPFVGWQAIAWGGPQRGDVVVCYSPEDGTRLVKRVIGLPGDRIELRGNALIVNGQPAVYEPLASRFIDEIDANEQPRHGYASERLDGRAHPIMTTPGIAARRSIDPVMIPDGRYLVLGDNRDLSRDSRWFGLVRRDQIAGRAFGVAISLDRNHWYMPRWHRFLRGMD